MSAAQRDFVVALSLANVCFIASWRALLYPPFSGYYLENPPEPIHVGSVMLSVVSLAVLLWCGMAIARRTHRSRLVWVARGAFVVLTFIALNGIRMQFDTLLLRDLIDGMNRLVFYAAFVVALAAGVSVFACWPRLLVGATVRAILILSPFVPVTFSQAAWYLAQENRERATGGASATGQVMKSPARRAVWIIFDELDLRAAFETERAPVELPELHRLREESFFATEAYPPADSTLKSIPALLTGRHVSEANPASYKELSITFASGGGEVLWSEQPNIFTNVRAMGGTTAAAGWYHPYCRLFSDTLNRCTRDLIDESSHASRPSLTRLLTRHARNLWDIVPMSHRLQKEHEDSAEIELELKREHVSQYTAVSEAAMAAVADRQLSLSLIHLPVPHVPPIYDRRTRAFSSDASNNYFDNLALADRTLGRMRRAMECAGVWDETIVLVSSDHWWRVEMWREKLSWTAEEQALTDGRSDRRVPFILKLPGRNTPFTYQSSFNTILSHDLLLALVRGELSSSAEVAAWIDLQRRDIASGR